MIKSLYNLCYNLTFPILSKLIVQNIHQILESHTVLVMTSNSYENSNTSFFSFGYVFLVLFRMYFLQLKISQKLPIWFLVIITKINFI